MEIQTDYPISARRLMLINREKGFAKFDTKRQRLSDQARIILNKDRFSNFEILERCEHLR